MIPLRDVIPSRTTPVSTLVLIAITLLVFAWELSATGNLLDRLLHSLATGTARPWIVPVALIFVHGTALQAGANALCLWMFGASVEDRLGHLRFALFYLLCGVVAIAAHVAASDGWAFPVVGANGAVAGLIGAYFVLYPNSRIVTLVPWFRLKVVEIPATFFVPVWLFAQLVNGIIPIGSIPVREPFRVGSPWIYGAAFLAGIGGVLILRRPERLKVEWWNDVRP